MPNLTGKLLGKVRVDMFLARGGMADVFIGTHTTLHRAVAIKFLKGDLQEDPDLRERFAREARVIAMLRHPNIVQVFDFDTYESQPYLVMEYVPGTSLSTYLRELHKHNGRLDINQINKLLGKVASALKYAHDNEVIHRDVKPANILLTSRTNPIEAGKPLADDAEPILTDFGLVRFTQATSQTSTGVITGTPIYMSPEQARGDQVDTRTDVYSLGVTVYEMLAGRVPFDSDSTLNLLHKQIYDPPPPIEGISSDLQAVMNRALAKNAEERFATPIEFAEAFQAAILGTTEASTIIVSNSSVQANPLSQTVEKNIEQKRNPFQPIIIGVVSILIILLGVFITTRALTPPTKSSSSNTAMPDMAMTNAPAELYKDNSSQVKPIGVLRFQDGTAKADKAQLTTSDMTPPPTDKQYQAWLIEDDGEQRISMGVITFDPQGKGSLTYVDPQGRNLIGIYHALEITLEPNPDNNPNPSGTIAFSSTLPSGGFMHVRHLLFSFSGTPNKIGFVRGLDASTQLINDSANQMLLALNNKDNSDIQLQAEKIMNTVVGKQSSDYKDWNNNGSIDDPSDGYGLLLNGSNLGYIQGTFTHANLSIKSTDATPNMLLHGEHVKISMTNVGDWTSELHDLLLQILQTSTGSDVDGKIRQAIALANQIRTGVDKNGNEIIEPIPGEGGALTAYQHAYYMADITIAP